MANSKPASRLKAEVQINLEADYTPEIDEIIKDWQSKGGIVIGSLNERFGKFSISFRRIPNALGDRITQMINDYYRENLT